MRIRDALLSARSYLTILLGFLLGAVSGYALQGKCRVARTVAGVYIWLIRGTPIVVQVMFLYFVLPLLAGLRNDLVQACVHVAGHVAAAYGAAIDGGVQCEVRSAFLPVFA